MLKRFVLFTLIAAMVLSLFAGCNKTEPETTPPTDVTTAPTKATVPTTAAPPPTTLPPETIAPTEPEETQPPTYPMGDMGVKTDGVLRSLEVGMSPACDSYPFGENILLCNPQFGIYQIRSLKDGSVLARATDANLANGVTVTDDQIIYYSVISHKIIFRDMNLEVVKTLDFSLNDMVAEMLFSQDGKKAYYCEDQQTLVELDLETMEQRVIPVSGPPIWALSGLYFEDTILRYWGKENGDDYYAFINLTTGGYLGKDNMSIQIWGNNYYLIRSHQGAIERLVVLDGSHRYMMPKDHGKRSCYTTVLPQLNSLFALSYDYDSPVVILDLYDLDTKQRTSSLTVDLGGEYGSSATVFVDTSGEYIWLCLKIGNHYNGYEMILYRWDFKANAIEDTTVYGYGG